MEKDKFKGEELDNVQLLVVFEDGNYHTELSKMYAKGGKVYRHKYIPTMTFEITSETANGYKGIQKDKRV